MADPIRRRVLRGILNGAAVTVALPMLDCFLNNNGTALADGGPMPVRFGTWFWGLGIDKSIFVPKKTGANFDLPEEMASLTPIQKHINVFTNLTAFRDTARNLCHFSGWVIQATGVAPDVGDGLPGPTFDTTISNKIGGTTRFKSLTATATGDVRDSFSYENPSSPNIADAAPVAFYTRLFGPGFVDPNATSFTVDPRAMVRKGVLSAVMDERQGVMQKIGAADKVRLDEYFSGLRYLERRLDQQMTKPEPIEACRPAKVGNEDPAGGDTDAVAARHRLLTDLMVMAVACDQTRVFNMATSKASSNTTKKGYEKPHHTCTHEERVDETLGYQPTASWFLRREMENWAYFVEAFTKIKEGDGTLLDNTLIYAFTDHGLARNHSLDGMAAFTAGRAGGKVKTGLHVDGAGTAGTRLGLTAMRVMGLDVPSWGTKSNMTSKEFGEILV